MHTIVSPRTGYTIRRGKEEWSRVRNEVLDARQVLRPDGHALLSVPPNTSPVPPHLPLELQHAALISECSNGTRVKKK